MSRAISRRGLLRGWALSALGVAAASVVGGSTLRGATPIPLAARLATLICDRASAVAIGQAHLAAAPGSGDRDRLERSVVAAVVSAAGTPSVDASGLEAMSDGALRALVDVAIRRDFRRGDIVRVRGWLLARTEVELCALAAIDPERGARS